MRAPTKVDILGLSYSILMLVGVFAKPLGIPSDWDSLPILAAIVCFYLWYRLTKKAKDSGQTAPTAPPEGQKRKRAVGMIGAAAIACAAGPFVLPATGVTLPFGVLVAISLVSFLFFIGLIWLSLKVRT